MINYTDVMSELIILKHSHQHKHDARIPTLSQMLIRIVILATYDAILAVLLFR